jgi:hypothetical protein
MRDWQPIETAPKDADVLLLFAEGWGVQPGYWDEHRWLCVETQDLTGGSMGDSGPTHWMPLPDPPPSHRSRADPRLRRSVPGDHGGAPPGTKDERRDLTRVDGDTQAPTGRIYRRETTR